MKKMPKITDFAFVLPSIIAVAVILGPFTSIAESVTIEIPVEAYDTANAAAVFPDEPDPSPDDQLLEIYGHLTLLSYLAFDLNQLPQGFEIVGATVSVFDIEPEHEDEVEITFLDVPTDWDRATLTYDMAVAQYGAVEATDSNDEPIAALDPAKILWLGKALMDNQTIPGTSTAIRTEMLSVSPFEEADLVAALKEEQTNGDGLVTMAIHGTTRNNNQILGIGFSDSEKGPTLSLTLAASGGSGTTTTYDFDDRTLQGWTQVWGSTTAGGPTNLGLISEDDPPVGNSVPPLPLSPPSFVGPVPFEAVDGTNTRDQAHETLLIRSPEFRIYPNGQISFGLIGGSHPNLDIEEITDANALPWNSSTSGAIGVALRRVSDGRYLGFYARSESGSQFWETITLGEDELSGLVSGDEMYTLDFIDYHNGGWGWGAIDSVVIIEGTPVTTYDFDDRTLQDWTQVWGSTTAGGPTNLGLISEDDPPVGNSVPPLPLSPPSFVGPVPFEAVDGTNTRDQAHETLLIRSPEFRIYPNGQISFGLIGGSHPNLDIEEITDANALPWNSSTSGAIGVALRRVSDGRYLGFYARSESGSQFWETITLGEDELSGLVSGDEMYTLDFIDYHNGGWGWGAIDSVVIIEGTMSGQVPSAIGIDFDSN